MRHSRYGYSNAARLGRRSNIDDTRGPAIPVAAFAALDAATLRRKQMDELAVEIDEALEMGDDRRAAQLVTQLADLEQS